MNAVALLPAVALVVGAAVGSADVSFAPSMSPLVALATVAAVACLLARDLAFVLFVAAAFACGGWTLAAHARHRALDTPLRVVLEREFGAFDIDMLGPGGRHDPVRFRGVLTEDAATAEELTTLRVRVTDVEIGHRFLRTDGMVAMSVPTPRNVPWKSELDSSELRNPVDEWLAGRTIEATATFRRPARYLDEGVRDSERDLALAGTTLFASVKSALLVTIVGCGNRAEEAAARVRQHVRRALGRWVDSLDPLSYAIAAAVLIGDRSGLPDEIRVRLQAAGTYHVIAISGGNIAILAAFCFAMFFLCGVAGRPATAFTLLVLLAYAGVVTAGASVWRATLMAVLYLIARMFDHRTAPWQAMGVAAAVVVCARPMDVRDAGFLLTFGATAALLEGARRTAIERGGLKTRWILASLVASAAAEIILLPVSASAFSRITSAGLLLNLVAVPLMSVVQIAAIVVAIFDRFAAIAFAAGWTTHAAAQGILTSARLVDAAPWLTTRMPPPPMWMVVLYYGALAATLLGQRRVRTCGVVVLVAAGIAIATGVGALGKRIEPGRLRLTMFDVGQGDAALVELPNGLSFLVDSGGIPFGSSGFDIGARVLAPALWARGIRRLDTLVLTHGDPDHIGGARAVIDDFSPRAVWQGIPVSRHVPMQELLAYARSHGAVVQERTAGEQFTFGAVRMRVLHPPPADWERPRVRNDDSVVLEVVYGDVAILLTGDISEEIERSIATRLIPARIRVLKVAHHGSRASSSAAFLAAWRPDVAIISAGRGNSFGHPTPQVIERLRTVGARIYRTDRDGEVTVDSDGNTISVRTFTEGTS